MKLAPRTTIGLALLSFLGCNEELAIDLETAPTGIYEAHTTIISDSCTWNGESSSFSALARSEAVIVDVQASVVNLPFQQHQAAVERFDLKGSEEFALHYEIPNECSTMVRDLSLLQLADQTIVTRSSIAWDMDEGCVPAPGVAPDASCSIETEETLYLLETCEAPCELRLNPVELECICSP